MRFGSVCSGIEAASVAWRPLGWRAAWLAEIEPFPCSLLAHHYPSVTNYGDMTALPDRIRAKEIEAPDVLCGGTPCQAFSVAGLRRSLDDARGNLSLTFCEIANAIDTIRRDRGEPECVVVWENVPGVLSTKDNAFGCFLAGLAGEDDPLQPPGGRWTNAGCVFGPQRTVAWRVLDAQYFGVAQRRRRVFVVASARDGFDPCSVLFEPEGVRRDIAPSREAREVAPTIPARSSGGGGLGTDFDCDGGLIAFPANLSATQHASAENLAPSMGAKNPTAVAIPIQNATRGKNQNGLGIAGAGEPMYTLDQASQHAVCFAENSRAEIRLEGGDGSRTGALSSGCGKAGQGVPCVAFTTEQTPKFSAECALTLTKQSPTGGGQIQSVMASMRVRRLTPRECERLQGFPDDYTLVPHRGKPAADGPRYKALGNSWAVPVVAWIGSRIAASIRQNP